MLMDDVFFDFEYLLYSRKKFLSEILKISVATMTAEHTPVLHDEVLEALSLEHGAIVIDATLGMGGHARSILQKIGKGKLLGFDWDENNRALASPRLIDFPQAEIVAASFSQMQAECSKRNIHQVNAILMDLGISSPHLDDAKRGFSFRHTGPLDMRMDSAQPQSAADLLNFLPEQELLHIFRTLGEEPFARPIAAQIVARRKEHPFVTTTDLFAVIETICYRNPKKAAARIFQALRITVNHELDELQLALPQAIHLLAPGGRLAIITFHSLEDRIVKNFFRDTEKASKGKTPSWRRINKKVIVPTESELMTNPRARSAKLRILEKISSS